MLWGAFSASAEGRAVQCFHIFWRLSEAAAVSRLFAILHSYHIKLTPRWIQSMSLGSMYIMMRSLRKDDWGREHHYNFCEYVVPICQPFLRKTLLSLWRWLNRYVCYSMFSPVQAQREQIHRNWRLPLKEKERQKKEYIQLTVQGVWHRGHENHQVSGISSKFWVSAEKGNSLLCKYINPLQVWGCLRWSTKCVCDATQQ